MLIAAVFALELATAQSGVFYLAYILQRGLRMIQSDGIKEMLRTYKKRGNIGAYQTLKNYLGFGNDSNHAKEEQLEEQLEVNSL